MYKSFIWPFLGKCFSITAVMLSWPGTFFGFRVFVAACISFRVKSFSRWCLCVGSFRNESTSCTLLLL
jgi:hypothetical protein